jgi:hypothetical protein
MLTKKITLRHLAWGLTIYSAVFNAVALLVLSCTTPSLYRARIRRCGRTAAASPH